MSRRGRYQIDRWGFGIPPQPEHRDNPAEAFNRAAELAVANPHFHVDVIDRRTRIPIARIPAQASCCNGLTPAQIAVPAIVSGILARCTILPDN